MSKIIRGPLRGDLVESEFIVSELCSESNLKQARPSTKSEAERINGIDGPTPQGQPRVQGRLVDHQNPPLTVAGSTAAHVSTFQTAKVQALRAIFADETENGRIASEQYRIARTKITQHPAKPQVILISGAAPGDGKTTTAIRLAAALSLNSSGDVLLLDADLRRNSVSTQLDLNWTSSLAGVICNNCELAEAIVRTDEFPSLCILQAGNVSKNPAEIFDSPEWLLLCKILRERFSYVVLDSPPMAAFADYELLQAVADGVIIVVRPDHTPRQPLADAIANVSKDKFVGVILNHVPRFFLFKTPHYKYYEYYSEKRKNVNRDK